MRALLLAVTLHGALAAQVLPGNKYFALQDKRLDAASVTSYRLTPNLCTCATVCRVSATCYGVAFGAMYVPNQTIALGTPNVCHVTTKPQLPIYLLGKAGYSSFIRDTGCDELKGYQNLGAAGCIWLSTYTRGWNGAQNECQAKGGRLAVLDTPAKYKAVVETLNSTQPRPNHQWVNAQYSPSGWKWEGGASVAGVWASGKPDGVSYADCGVMSNNMNFLLDNTYCSSWFNFVCQMPPQF
ncbi:uncharacterized protein LOC108665319 [Hyalella azteca]|uniref:Uncharacterized protein LOC108665319 n=1 Tax=Hyalella azteca TaxID=294128 RepID=A0A8B7N139_HYAAZ|nr:uncharacterized protein LOC108665319 [Hyalella azteca]